MAMAKKTRLQQLEARVDQLEQDRDSMRSLFLQQQEVNEKVGKAIVDMNTMLSNMATANRNIQFQRWDERQ